MPSRLTPMATDGQGVLLAVNQSSDTRQRTTMDILARRVAHRLGCPVAVVNVQRGVPLMQAPIEQLAAKGVRNVVLVPVDPYQPLVKGFADQPEGVEVRVGPSSVRVRLADGVVADPLLVDAMLEALITSERSPDPEATVIVALPESMNGLARRLSRKDSAVKTAGWGGLGFVDVPSQDPDPSSQLPLRLVSEPLTPRGLVVPLAVNPGAFVVRCEAVSAHIESHFSGGVEFAPITLHSTTVLGQMIKDRVQVTRRN